MWSPKNHPTFLLVIAHCRQIVEDELNRATVGICLYFIVYVRLMCEMKGITSRSLTSSWLVVVAHLFMPISLEHSQRGQKRGMWAPTCHMSITHLLLLGIPRLEECTGTPLPRCKIVCPFVTFFFFFKSIIWVIEKRSCVLYGGSWQIFLLDDSNWSFMGWRVVECKFQKIKIFANVTPLSSKNWNYDWECSNIPSPLYM